MGNKKIPFLLKDNRTYLSKARRVRNKRKKEKPVQTREQNYAEWVLICGCVGRISRKLLLLFQNKLLQEWTREREKKEIELLEFGGGCVVLY